MNGLQSLVSLALALLCATGGESGVLHGLQSGPCRSGGSTRVGAYKPQCTYNGFYQVEQYHSSTGHSWCVNPETGTKVESSDVPPTQAPQCGNCFKALAKFLNFGLVVVGRPRPACDAEGRFNAFQSNPSTGYSFCVDPETGAKVENSEVAAGAGRAHCDAAGVVGLGLTLGPCAAAFQAAKPLIGTYVAQCDDQGYYKPLQINPSTGYSWCVDRQTGAKIEGSDSNPTAVANCEAAPVGLTLGPCAAAFQAAKPLIGTYVAQCDDQGYYKPLQFNPSTGYSFCVDRQTGAKIAGTDTSPTSVADCDAAPLRLTLGPCAAAFQAAKPLIGTFVAQCDDQGYYKKLQINPSTGYSFCVDRQTGAKIEGSEVHPAAGQANCEAAPLGLTLGPCAAEFQAAKPLLGTFVPRCDDRGFYTSIQTHEGRRFCVDTNTGKQLPGSPSFGPGENGKLPCEN